MGASRVAMVTLAASSGRREHHWCSPAWVSPTFLAAIPEECRAGSRLLGWHSGDAAGGQCQVSSEQMEASPQLQPVALGVCSGPPSPKKVTLPFPQHVLPLIRQGPGLQGQE